MTLNPFVNKLLTYDFMAFVSCVMYLVKSFLLKMCRSKRVSVC